MSLWFFGFFVFFQKNLRTFNNFTTKSIKTLKGPNKSYWKTPKRLDFQGHSTKTFQKIKKIQTFQDYCEGGGRGRDWLSPLHPPLAVVLKSFDFFFYFLEAFCWMPLKIQSCWCLSIAFVWTFQRFYWFCCKIVECP